MRKRMALNGLALLGLLTSTTVLAEIQPGFYVGAGVGSATIELDQDPALPNFKFDADDTAFKLFGGYNFNKYFAVEAAYFDAGNPEETVIVVGNRRGTLDVGTTGLIASAIGRIPLGDMFSVYGKLGVASYEVEIKGRVNGDVVDEDEGTEDDVSYGVGAAFNIGSAFELRAEYETISISDGDFTVLSVSGLYRF